MKLLGMVNPILILSRSPIVLSGASLPLSLLSFSTRDILQYGIEGPEYAAVSLLDSSSRTAFREWRSSDVQSLSHDIQRASLKDGGEVGVGAAQQNET